jgi:hypothetical protein
MRPEQAEPNKPEIKSETGTSVRGKTNVQGNHEEMNKNEPGTTRNESGARSSTSTSTNETNMKGTSHTTVNKEEFKSRHSEVFSLSRHPKEFFVQRYGASHFQLIGNTYFVFVDGCWVAVDVDGFVFTQRVICQGDPDFIEIE